MAWRWRRPAAAVALLLTLLATHALTRHRHSDHVQQHPEPTGASDSLPTRYRFYPSDGSASLSSSSPARPPEDVPGSVLLLAACTGDAAAVACASRLQAGARARNVPFTTSLSHAAAAQQRLQTEGPAGEVIAVVAQGLCPSLALVEQLLYVARIGQHAVGVRSGAAHIALLAIPGGRQETNGQEQLEHAECKEKKAEDDSADALPLTWWLGPGQHMTACNDVCNVVSHPLLEGLQWLDAAEQLAATPATAPLASVPSVILAAMPASKRSNPGHPHAKRPGTGSSSALPLCPPSSRTASTLFAARRAVLLAPWLEMGGADEAALQLVRQAEAAGVAVTVVTTQPSAQAWHDAFAAETDGDIHHLARLGSPEMYLAYVRTLLCRRRPQAVIVSHAEWGYTVGGALRRWLAAGARLVDLTHVVEPTWHGGGHPRLAVLAHPLFAPAGSNARHATAYAGLGDWLHDHGVSKASTVTCYIDTAGSAGGDDGDEVEEHGYRVDEEPGVLLPPLDKSVVVLFAGRLVRQKGISALLEVTAHVCRAAKDVFVIVAGDGPLRGVVEAAAAAPSQSCLRVLGAVPRSTMAQLYRRADLVLLPSRYEGIPAVIYDAMAAGCTVLAANVGGIHELLSNTTGRLLWVDDEGRIDVGATAVEVLALARDSTARARLGAAAAAALRAHREAHPRLWECISGDVQGETRFSTVSRPVQLLSDALADIGTAGLAAHERSERAWQAQEGAADAAHPLRRLPDHWRVAGRLVFPGVGHTLRAAEYLHSAWARGELALLFVVAPGAPRCRAVVWSAAALPPLDTRTGDVTASASASSVVVDVHVPRQGGEEDQGVEHQQGEGEQPKLIELRLPWTWPMLHARAAGVDAYAVALALVCQIDGVETVVACKTQQTSTGWTCNKGTVLLSLLG